MSLFVELKRRNVLRVAAAYVAVSWLLIQVAETTFPAFGLGDGAMRAVIIVLVVGLIPMLILAWAFELTPEGFRREAEVDHGSASSVRMTRRLDRLIMVFLALALGYFAFDKFLLDPARDQAREQNIAEQARSEALVEFYGDKSIAVLPFANVSSDPEQAYMADGISEELLKLLARIPELRVISRASAFSFKGKDVEIPAIAEELHVAHVLVGSVRRSGDRIQITTQLKEARTDTDLWSETYDRALSDVFDIQDEISANVVKQLRIALLDEAPEARRTDPEVFSLTLQARYIEQVGAENSTEEAYALVDRALELDPDYIPAMHLLALVNYFRMREGLIDRRDSMRLQRELMHRVLATDPDDGVATAYLAWTAFEKDRDLEKAAAGLAQAVGYEPGNGEVLRLAGSFARYIGRFEESVEILDRAAERDPLCFNCLWQLSVSYMVADRLEEAEAVRRKYIKLGSGGFYYLAFMELMRGDPQAALEALETDEIDPSQRSAARAMALHDLGRATESKILLDDLVERWGEERPDVIAGAYAWIDDKDAAFDWLDRAYGEEHNYFYKKIFEPVYRNLHEDPRWIIRREQAGMSAARLAGLEFDVDLPD